MLPDGPSGGPIAQTVALHRDPLAFLRAAQLRYGDVFTLRLATARPIVVAADPASVDALLESDPVAARAGDARRAILPLVSPRSVFGGDGEHQRAARNRIAGCFSPDAAERRAGAMVRIAEQHIDRWPRRRPFRLLPTLRSLVDDVFVRLLLGVRDEGRAMATAAAIRRMLWTPGNVPFSIPGRGDGVLGSVAAARFERRCAPLTALLGEEVRQRGGDDGDDVIAAILRAAPRSGADEIADELLPLLMAAQEPAAAALTWLLDRLGRSGSATDGFLAGGEVRDAVVRETLRLQPPAFAGLRRLTEPRVAAGHALPARAVVVVPTALIQRDPRAFAAPDAFRPERWTSARPPDSPVFPFGGGARRCLGEHLARCYIDALVPPIVARRRLEPVARAPERAVLRGTILVPRRGAVVRSHG